MEQRAMGLWRPWTQTDGEEDEIIDVETEDVMVENMAQKVEDELNNEVSSTISLNERDVNLEVIVDNKCEEEDITSPNQRYLAAYELKRRAKSHANESANDNVLGTKKVKKLPSKAPIECNICFKTFKRKQYLKSHLQLHSNYFKFECFDCHKQFKRKADLIKHQRTHTGMKPFSCRICFKSFGRRDTLNHHLQNHSETNRKNAYACSSCKRTFASVQALFYHRKTHLGVKAYKCYECHKKFLTKSHLKSHFRVHTRQHKRETNVFYLEKYKNCTLINSVLNKMK